MSGPDQPVVPAPSTVAAGSPATPSATAADAGTPVVRPPAHDAGEIARTARVGTKSKDVIYDIRPADAKTDRWTVDAACSTAAGASRTATATYVVRLVGDDKHPDDLKVVASGELECTSTRMQVDGLELDGRGVQIDITAGSEPVGSYYGLVHATA